MVMGAPSGALNHMRRPKSARSECGDGIRKLLDSKGGRPENVDDETTYDSDDYPKGPYPDGGGEADSPQHCDGCAVFLENDLTSEGREYVQETINRDEGDPEILQTWSQHYDIYPERSDDSDE